jgi:hypothetical protein
MLALAPHSGCELLVVDRFPGVPVSEHVRFACMSTPGYPLRRLRRRSRHFKSHLVAEDALLSSYAICFPGFNAYFRVFHTYIRIFAANLAIYPPHV